MTVRCDLLDVLKMFPRYDGQKWSTKGRKTAINMPVTTRRNDASLRKWIGRMEDDGCWPVIRWLDVSGDNVYVLHRHVYCQRLMQYAKRAWSWQTKEKRSNLPVVVKLRGVLYVWNGTHRTTLCRLARKRLRAKVFDVDAFLAFQRRRSRK